MTKRDMDYYEDQKSDRLMICENRCDSLFYQTWLKEQRQQEAKETWKKEKRQLFKFRSLKDIKKLLIEHGEVVSDDSDEDDSPVSE